MPRKTRASFSLEEASRIMMLSRSFWENDLDTPEYRKALEGLSDVSSATYSRSNSLEDIPAIAAEVAFIKDCGRLVAAKAITEKGAIALMSKIVVPMKSGRKGTK